MRYTYAAEAADTLRKPLPCCVDGPAAVLRRRRGVGLLASRARRARPRVHRDADLEKAQVTQAAVQLRLRGATTSSPGSRRSSGETAKAPKLSGARARRARPRVAELQKALSS